MTRYLNNLARPINADAFQVFRLGSSTKAVFAFSVHNSERHDPSYDLRADDVCVFRRNREVAIKFDMQKAALNKCSDLYILGMVLKSFENEGLEVLFLRGVQDSLDHVVICQEANLAQPMVSQDDVDA
jgi:hypothetical protein